MTELHTASAFSVSFWFKMPTLATNNALVAKWQWSSTNASPPRQATFYIQTSEGADGGDNGHDIEVAIATSASDGGCCYGYSTTHPFSDNTWAHVVVIYNGTQTGNANRLKVYVNDSQLSLGFQGTIPAALTSASDPVKFGTLDGLGRYLNGSMDEIGIWDKALTSAEVADLYHDGKGDAFETGPYISGDTLQQYKSDATTTIAKGGVTYENEVVFGANLKSASGTAQIQIELATSTANFSGAVTASSAAVSSGSFATTSISGLAAEGWVNGVSQGSITTSGTGGSGASDGFELFSSADIQPGNQIFSGKIDECGIWSKKLSSQEVADLWNRGGGDAFFATQNYYAQIQNGPRNLRDGSSTTGTNVLKTLPSDWILHVVSTTNSNGSLATTTDGTWFKVVDPTDGVTGWMVASDTSSQYISSYDGSGTVQSDMAASSSAVTVGTSTGETGNYVLSAIDSYYNESSTVDSLYSNNDHTGINANTSTPPGSNLYSDISILKQRGFEEKVILGIAALEDGGTGFNNQIVTDDYGHGIMQVTPNILYHELHDGNAYSSTNDPRGIASGVTIPPCASYMTSTYTNCYAYSGGGDGSDAHYYIPNASVSGSPTFKQYANTPQSIYANVKDGLQILASKYGTNAAPMNRVCDNYPDPVTISSTIYYATTTYSCTDEEIIDLTAAYNGSSSPYLSEVASRLTDINTYFPSITSSDASTTDIINKLNVANYNSVYFALHSPGDLSVQDAHGHIIGVVNGVVTDTFPFATYDPATKSGYIFFPQDSNLTYKVVGTGSGVYGLDVEIASGTQQIAFHRDENVPITPGEVHSYTIDPNSIARGKNGVTLKIDKKGNGTINETDQFGAVLTTVQRPKFLPLPSTPYIPVVLPSQPAKKKISVPPVYIPPMIATSTANVYTSTPAFASSTLELEVASSTISTSTNQNQ